MFERLDESRYAELDRFVEGHRQGGFTQLSAWRRVKAGWGYEALIRRDQNGRVTGALSVLVRRFPLGSSLLYAPRGPVCDPHDRETLADLKAGVDELARIHNAHAFKMDPEVAMADEGFRAIAGELGFRQKYGPEGFEGIQARFNYRLPLEGRTEDELFANLSQSARRKVRIAMKNGVEARAVGSEYLDDFVRIMRVTGERDGFATRPRAYFERFLAALGEHARLYAGFYQGEMVCGAVAASCSGRCCYVYGASDNAHRDVMPNYLMQWEMIRWAVETGCWLYDFQGVSGNLEPENNPMFGLYQFKKGFNGALDELAGEFDYLYKPARAGLLDAAVSLNDRLRHLRHRRPPSPDRA